MAKIKVNVRPYQGEYDLDMDSQPLTMLEWRWVKKISGYMPLTINEGFRGEDPDVYIALAVIAMARADKINDQDAMRAAERLATAPFDGESIGYVPEQQDGEDDADDPPADPAVTPVRAVS